MMPRTLVSFSNSSSAAARHRGPMTLVSEGASMCSAQRCPTPSASQSGAVGVTYRPVATRGPGLTSSPAPCERHQQTNRLRAPVARAARRGRARLVIVTTATPRSPLSTVTYCGAMRPADPKSVGHGGRPSEKLSPGRFARASRDGRASQEKGATRPRRCARPHLSVVLSKLPEHGALCCCAARPGDRPGRQAAHPVQQPSGAGRPGGGGDAAAVVRRLHGAAAQRLLFRHGASRGRATHALGAPHSACVTPGC